MFADGGRVLTSALFRHAADVICEIAVSAEDGAGCPRCLRHLGDMDGEKSSELWQSERHSPTSLPWPSRWAA